MATSEASCAQASNSARSRVGGLLERRVAQRAEAREEHEQRAARDRADRVELQAADPLGDGCDRAGPRPPARRGGGGQPLRVQRQPARLRDRDAARGQMPSPGRNSFVNARWPTFASLMSLFSAIHTV